MKFDFTREKVVQYHQAAVHLHWLEMFVCH